MDMVDNPAVSEDEEAGFDKEFLAAMKRLVYGVESIMDTIPEAWTDERDEILHDIAEVRERWPDQNL